MRRNYEIAPMTAWHPWREMHDLFSLVVPWQSGWPAVDIEEDDDTYTVTIEAPGFQKDQIEVEIKENTVWVSGNAQEEKENQEKRSVYRERVNRSFQRAFRLPQDVAAEQAKASYTEGILRLELPKQNWADNSRRLAIQ